MSIRDVAFSYGKVRALAGVTLDIRAGEIVALLGPNGAGKSTLTHIMLGLLSPQAGRVSLFGASPEDAVAQGRVGVMLQDTGLMRYVTVRELVGLVAAQYGRAAGTGDILHEAGLTGLETRRVSRLSGGQRQRVKFALAIAGDPELLFLDEPTAALDVQARHAFWRDILARAGRGRTIVFATHYIEEAEAYANRIVVLRDGKVVADGPARQIMTRVSDVTIRFSTREAKEEELAKLPGIVRVDAGGAAAGHWELVTSDQDATLDALYGAGRSGISGLEISRTSLEDVLLALTKETGQ
ncbi:ABC transporter ATP-binding protein [Sphaerisporangium krabiense]|uniref:ABC-2 type transport system ATP-binding protein n=1 Tax=Sphaerisporangium krabiense TaxID=763782 RepID=A0A7W8Z7C5_9ACTN|nr:ABC transporter ATP-binding protein [Sphaerisporangium krabiense]MBB5628727.1 ABC-2 type transport system ATP-binding protein [Sphaerisporangium krabiense]